MTGVGARSSCVGDREDDHAVRLPVVVVGTVENQGDFYDRFEHVVLLTAPLEVPLERCRTRTTNPYGRTPEQQADIRRCVREVEPLLRAGATLVLDGRRPVAELADVVGRL